MPSVNIPPLGTQISDINTGLVSNIWHRFFMDMQAAVNSITDEGSTFTPSPPDTSVKTQGLGIQSIMESGGSEAEQGIDIFSLLHGIDKSREPNVEDGTASGQMLFWDGVNKYIHTETSELVWDDTNKRFGISTSSPTAKLHLPAGTASAGTAPIKFTSGTVLTTPEAGTLEYDGCKLYLTNVATRKAIDRTSDVVVSTVTCENTTTETTLWTGSMVANSLCAGNMFKFHGDGIIQNGGATSADEVTLRIKVGGSTVATLNPTTKAIPVGSHWHIDANATQRTIGATGSRAIHIDLAIDDTEDEIISVATIDTTADMTVTITAQWASADADNIISLYQGFMEYKN